MFPPCALGPNMKVQDLIFIQLAFNLALVSFSSSFLFKLWCLLCAIVPWNQINFYFVFHMG